MKIQFELCKHEIHRLNEVFSTDTIKEIEKVKSYEKLKLKEGNFIYELEWEYCPEENLVIIHTVFKY